MIGDYQLVIEDVAEARKFDDVIAKSGMPASAGGPFHSAAHPGRAMNLDPDRKMARPKDGGQHGQVDRPSSSLGL